MTSAKPLRSGRSADRVSRRLFIDPECAADELIEACLRLGCTELNLPRIEVVVSTEPSRARPEARGRFTAGVITLFPRAFADHYVLAFTMLHELAHAAGRDETAADAFALATLDGP